jgi:V-type H+-transporting ATPase proteolipid subunit
VNNIFVNTRTYQDAEYTGYCLFFAGLIVGVSNAACGMSVGVIGSGTVNTHAQKPETFVSMLIIEIFASALGLYGIIIGIIMSNNAIMPSVVSAEMPYGYTAPI